MKKNHVSMLSDKDDYMKKVFLSQPMKGRSNDQINLEREAIVKQIKKELNEPFEIMDTVFDDFDGSTPLKFLAMSLMVMADADCAYFANGWRETRGCLIEHACAKSYDIPIIRD